MDRLASIWFLALLFTGIAAGAMTGHALLLGRFLAWCFRSARIEIVVDAYSAFLRAAKPERFFDHLFTLGLLATAAFNAALFFAGRTYPLALVALGLQVLFAAFFLGSGFGTLERKLFAKGDTNLENVERFLALNMPVTALSALLLVASFGCLAWIRL